MRHCSLERNTSFEEGCVHSVGRPGLLVSAVYPLCRRTG